MKIVISLGGSVIVPDEINTEYFKRFADFAKEIHKKHEVAIVTGGGRLARKYIEPARRFGANEAFCDFIGIEATRLNSMLMIAAIGDDANSKPLEDFEKAKNSIYSKKIVVMGGTHPGHSTDAVSAILAEYINADLLINATNVNGIYDKDPKRYKDAVMYEKLPADKLVEIVASHSLDAGNYKLIDILAAKIIQRSRIRTIFLNGNNLENIRNAINGKKFVGTVIISR